MDRQDLFEGELFDIRRSVRYHMHRCRFYDNFHDVSTALSVILGVATVATVLSSVVSNGTVAAIGAFVSLLGILDLVIGTTQKARLHNTLAGKFLDLEKRMIREGVSCLDDVKLARLEIEKEEPPILDVLNIICHNEVMKAQEYSTGQLAKIGWFQRLVANLFDFRPHAISYTPPVLTH